MKAHKFLPIIISIIAISVVAFVFPANAQSIPTVTIDKPISEMTIPELQAKIIELTQAIQQLQTLLAQLQEGTPPLPGAPAVKAGIPSSYTFNTNLKYGTSSIDVKYLQIFLNADPDTRVSSTGWGSPGQESMFFGPKTKQAVIKFQEKYASETLSPWKLSKGTGFVGQTTRDKINQLLEQYRAGEGAVIPPTPEVECGPADNICPSGCTFSQDTDCNRCGDGIIQTPNSEGSHEVCDTDNLNNKTCMSRGYASGNLSCSNDCLTFNVSVCLLAGGGSPSPGGGVPAPEPEPEPVCGAADGICPSGCTHAQDPDCTYCGDNIIQSPNNEGIDEVCDGTSLTEETCITKGFPGGDLACSSDCLTFNTADCTSPSPLNDPPVLDPIGNKAVNENQELSFTISAADPNNDTLSYSVQDLPTGAVFNPVAQTFAWTPTYEQSGTYNLTFIVSDGSLTDSEEITITVSNINRAPSLAPIGSQSVNEGQTLTFTISATDPDNDSLTYSIQGLVSGTTFQDQTFSWTPTYEQSGAYNFTFIVSDTELTDSEEITITVQDVCVLTTCSILGYECGNWDDGCGSTLNCGTCQSGYNCENGQCVQETPEPYCGDGTCNGTETCSTCPGDCGTCPTGNIYYLDAVNGDDSNLGTSGAPWQTVAKAQSTLQDGDTVILRDGSYGSFTDNGDRSDWIVYKADTGHTPVFTYLYLSTYPGPHDLYLQFEGITVTPGNEHHRTVTSYKGNYVKLIDMTFIGDGYEETDTSAGVFLYHSSNIIIDNCIFTSVSGLPEGGFNAGVYGRYSHDITVTNCDITRCRSGLSVWGRRWTISNNHLYDLDSDGILLANVADSIIEGNYIHAIYPPIYFTYDGGCFYNDATKTVTANAGEPFPSKTDGYIRITPEAAGPTDWYFIESATSNTITLSNAIGQDYADIPLIELKKGYHADAIQPYNVPADDPSNPEFIYIKNINISRNRIHGVSQGIFFSVELGSEDIRIENNLVYDCGMEVRMIGTKNLVFNSNTIPGDHEGTWHVDTTGSLLVQAQKIPDPDIISTIKEFANNIIDFPSISVHNDETEPPEYEDYNIFSEWWSYTPGPHSVEYDLPEFKGLFVDYDNDNFKLAVGYPTAVDYCPLTYAPPTDLEGNTRVDIPGIGNDGFDYADAGCYEYQDGTQECSGTDTSCGTWPSCQNCNTQDGCVETVYRDYYCSGTSCLYTTDDCSDCSCTCAGYNTTESISNNNCSDSIDNDCNGYTDSSDTGCQQQVCTPGQTQSCSTGLQGICSSGTETCQSDSTWGSCVQDNQPSTEICTDSLDNDCDGQTDCSDSDCSSVPVCQTTGIPLDYISYYKFENNVNDETGTNNGTINGNPQFVSGVQGQALDFDGDGDYVEVASSLDYGQGANYTISVWFKTSHDYSAERGAVYFTDAFDGKGWIRFDTNNKMRISIYDGSVWAEVITSTTYNDGIWHHGVLLVKSGNQIEFFIDGNSIGVDSVGTIPTASFTACIGMRENAGVTEEFNGTIDEVIIYNRALSESEIQDIYDAQKPAGHGTMLEPSEDQLAFNSLASILSAIQGILEKIKSLF